MRRWIVIGIPYVWLLIFFLIPFIIVFKISLSDVASALPPSTRGAIFQAVTVGDAAAAESAAGRHLEYIRVALQARQDEPGPDPIASPGEAGPIAPPGQADPIAPPGEPDLVSDAVA